MIMPDLFDPNAPMPDFQSQQANVAQQQAFAQALRKQAGAIKQPEGQMVGKTFVAPHWTQQLATVLQQFNPAWQENIAQQAQQKYQQGINQATQQWQSQLPQSIPGQPATPGHPELQGPQAETGSPELAAKEPTPEVPAQLPGRSAVLQATLTGMKIPGNEKAAELWSKGMQEEQTREDVQAAKLEDRNLQRQLSRENLSATLAQHQRESELRSQDMRLSIQEREQAARDANSTKRYIGDLVAAVGRDKISATQSNLKPLPSAASKSWMENNSALRQVDQALDLVDKNPDAFGGAKSMLPVTLQNKLDKEGISARAAVGKLSSLRIHELSGANVTAAESPRLKPHIPVLEGPFKDDAPTIRKKLRLFMQEYNNMQSEISNFADTQQYRPPGEVYKSRARDPKLPGYEELAGQEGDINSPSIDLQDPTSSGPQLLRIPDQKERESAIKDLTTKYGMGGSKENPFPITTPAEALRLPAGTIFKTPDGKIKVR